MTISSEKTCLPAVLLIFYERGRQPVSTHPGPYVYAAVGFAHHILRVPVRDCSMPAIKDNLLQGSAVGFPSSVRKYRIAVR